MIELAGKHRGLLVYVAPGPGFSRLEGLNQEMAGFMEVLGGVFVLGGVAAADVAALEANPQVNPGVAGLQALLAALGIGGEVRRVGL